MKKNNKGRRSIKSMLLILFGAVNIINAQMKVDVQPLPEPSIDSMPPYTGTLTEVAKSLRGSEAGLYDLQYTWDPVNFTPKKEECECKTKEEKEKTYNAKIKASELTAKLSFNIKILLPVWTERGKSTCQSATNEWNSFYAKVKAHEEGHHVVAKGFFTQTKVEGYFKGIKDLESKQCVKESQYEKESSNLVKESEKKYDAACQKVMDEYSDAQKEYHKNVGATVVLDASKECF